MAFAFGGSNPSPCTSKMQDINKFAQLIEESQRILITSHISPDPDAVSSVLLLGSTLKQNYPDKQVTMVMEEEPLSDLSFLRGYNLLKFAPLDQTIKDIDPDLFIIVDANSYGRVARNKAEQIRSYITKRRGEIKTAIIDHHELDGREDTDVFINNKRPATAEEIYTLCFEQMQLEKPEGYAETTLLGIMSDTQRHRFDHPGHRETYRIVSDLLDAGASIEKLESKLEHYNKNELEVIAHLAANITSQGGYTYSFIADEFMKDWQAQNKPITDLKNASELFVNIFIRSFEGNSWGFIIYPELIAGPQWWGVSFRSVSGGRDVAKLANKLGGGGHKPAAGAKIEAGNVIEAIEKVVQTISSS